MKTFKKKINLNVFICKSVEVALLENNIIYTDSQQTIYTHQGTSVMFPSDRPFPIHNGTLKHLSGESGDTLAFHLKIDIFPFCNFF